MTSIKRLRVAGYILLAVSALVLVILGSSSIRSRYAAAPDGYAVLIITENTDLFPAADYDALFSSLQIPSFCCVLDADSDPEASAAAIDRAVKDTGSKHVILLAYKDAALPVLRASVGQADTAALILLAPTLKQTDSMELYGTASPPVRTAIFTNNSAYSTALYERLSGEDTTLFPGIQSGSRLASTAFISPDASRYIESWKLTGHESADRTILTFLPDTEVRVAEYINNYVLPAGQRSEANLNRDAAVFQVLKILASAGLVAGLLLFFASIPKPPRKDSLPADPASVFVREKDVAAAASLRKTTEASLVLSLLFGILASTAAAVLFLTGNPAEGAVLFFWPLLYYAADAILHFRSFAKHMAAGKISSGRLFLSLSMMFLFLLGCGSIRFMYTAGLSGRDALSGALAAGMTVFLILFSWISASSDARVKTFEDSRLDADLFWRKMVLFLPFISRILVRMAAGAFFDAALSLVLVSLLLVCLKIRTIFRRITGADWGGAIVFSVLYALTVII